MHSTYDLSNIKNFTVIGLKPSKWLDYNTNIINIFLTSRNVIDQKQ